MISTGMSCWLNPIIKNYSGSCQKKYERIWAGLGLGDI